MCGAPGQNAMSHSDERQQQTLERLAVALERQNDLLARQSDIAFVQLNSGDQQKVDAWDRRRQEDLQRHGGAPADPAGEP
jgi:hypothetical protein